MQTAKGVIMLNERLIVQTAPKAHEKNIVYWMDYRVTVLADRLFRVEKNKMRKFRDDATQAVWFRNMEPQDYKLSADDAHAVIETSACRLILYKERGQVCVEFGSTRKTLDNYGNLLGTCRTLDRCNGDDYYPAEIVGEEKPKKVTLGKGVCSTTGVAVLDDSQSLTLGADGQVKPILGEGSDEYVFVYGDDYRAAVRALYMICGTTPLLPRYALGNWWSRYHVYTDEEYIRVLNKFEDRNIPISVATVDMDWHYSDKVDQQKGITESGKNTPEQIGTDNAPNMGWTGYSWNKYLFRDPKGFLDRLHEKGVKITLNLHPSSGIRWWEDCYENMANAMGIDYSQSKYIPFEFTYDRFINAYFDLVHAPHEAMGVDFWWIDWQQENIEWRDNRPYWERAATPIEMKYDPLWALNHYHYYDNASKNTVPLILSRYAGVGSHRYPVGFSGDTVISWKTLAYLPYFTATASNIGYTWWSHDIGGHNYGEKSDELFVRHVQYGVFSPINRLHCTCDETMTKEPWMYGSAGLVIGDFLRFRHKLVPYLYNASYRNCVDGKALVEPIYYEWKDKPAYNYREEYLFGSELLVAPVTQKQYPDGYARVRAWLPQGKWTDIFTGDVYEIAEGGREVMLLRGLDSIPVFAKAGAIIPLSLDNKNAVKNPEKMEIWAFEGTNVYSLYEDGLDEQKYSALLTEFKSEFLEVNGACTQSLAIFTHGDGTVIPENREMRVLFKNVEKGRVRFFIDGMEEETYTTRLSDCLEVRFAFDPTKTYRIEVIYEAKTRLEKWIAHVTKVLTTAAGENTKKLAAWKTLSAVQTEEEFVAALEGVDVDYTTKLRLYESL